jgi:iron complex outermembrane receptor protein
MAPSSTIISARASLQQIVNSWRITEYARIDNLFDKDYIGSIRVNDTNTRFFEPAPGRNWIAGVKATYTF